MITLLKALATGHRRTPPYSPEALLHGQRIGHALCRWLLNVQVSGAENVPLSGPLLLAGNHTGILDGPLVMVWAPRPVRTLTKVQIYRSVVGSYLHHIGQVPLDRDRPDRRALKLCLGELQRGGAVCIFPEGTRGTGTLDEVKDGVAYLAAASLAPVVPVACLGTQQALAKGKKWPSRKAPIHVVFGLPFTPDLGTDHTSRESLHQVGEAIRLRLREHLETVERATARQEAA